MLFRHESIPSEVIAAELGKRNICVRGGYHCAALAHKALGTPKGGAVRASFGYFNSDKDIDKLYLLHDTSTYDLACEVEAEIMTEFSKAYKGGEQV